ncbi:MAG TPA: hypothetical protein EYH31_08115 [Anaerolineae bacterium]|nr:hypothetical protein [Anaerolineae bacterium]
MRIKVVGPCASGKTVLVERLQALGYDAYQCLQEHSYVPDMWQRVNPADVLIYLDVTSETALARRPSWSRAEHYLTLQRARLAHARRHCDLYISTDGLTPDEVANQAVVFLRTLLQPFNPPGEC